MRATRGLVRRIAEELQGAGTHSWLTGERLPAHAEISRLLGGDPST
jgi:hypothetical protein